MFHPLSAIIAAARYPGFSYRDQAVSELSAVVAARLTPLTGVRRRVAAPHRSPDHPETRPRPRGHRSRRHPARQVPAGVPPPVPRGGDRPVPSGLQDRGDRRAGFRRGLAASAIASTGGGRLLGTHPRRVRRSGSISGASSGVPGDRVSRYGLPSRGPRRRNRKGRPVPPPDRRDAPPLRVRAERRLARGSGQRRERPLGDPFADHARTGPSKWHEPTTPRRRPVAARQGPLGRRDPGATWRGRRVLWRDGSS